MFEDGNKFNLDYNDITIMMGVISMVVWAFEHNGLEKTIEDLRKADFETGVLDEVKATSYPAMIEMLSNLKNLRGKFL